MLVHTSSYSFSKTSDYETVGIMKEKLCFVR